MDFSILVDLRRCKTKPPSLTRPQTNQKPNEVGFDLRGDADKQGSKSAKGKPEDDLRNLLSEH